MNYYLLTFMSFQLLFAKPIVPPAQEYRLEDCDVCGCSATGGSMGFNSLLNDHFIGIRYMYQSYKTKEGIFNNSPWISERFNSIQLWGKYPLSEKFDVMALIPYHLNNREKKEKYETVNGMGDATLILFYNMIKPNQEKTYQAKLQLGMGVKAPTGSYNESNNGSINPSFQLGTGSWDYTFTADYTLSKNNLGFNAMMNYIVKTENKKNYKFGNQTNYAVAAFYQEKLANVVFMPNLGIAGEVYQFNEEFSERVPSTEGTVLFAKGGLELAYKKWGVGIHTMIPLQQNLTGGKVEAEFRMGLNVTYAL